MENKIILIKLRKYKIINSLTKLIKYKIKSSFIIYYEQIN